MGHRSGLRGFWPERCAPATSIRTRSTEETFGRHLSLGDLPPPDLCIRTGGERRLSNFLLWDFAYTEFHFCDDYWPDFDEERLDHAFADFASRQRRYGGRTAERAG